MVGRKSSKLNQLQQLLPEGLLVDTTWLDARGYRRQWREKYVAQGWLQGVVRSVYRRPSAVTEVSTPWQRVVISLQRLLEQPVHVGGRTALELQGLTHYLRMNGPETVQLYAYAPLPGWVAKVPTNARFREHRASRLFPLEAPGLTTLEWGHWGWKLGLSAPERALCELLDDVPHAETFAQADVLMESAASLSPRRVQAVLEACTSIKAKRLFLWAAERHRHAWLKHVDLARIDLGSGKRQIAPGGRYDAKYRITVPEDIDGGG